MDLLNIRSHFHDGARQAAGTFLSPLTNAIGEQRRLVESMAMVSRVRVEECKHMMAWGKCQVSHLSSSGLKGTLQRGRVPSETIPCLAPRLGCLCCSAKLGQAGLHSHTCFLWFAN